MVNLQKTLVALASKKVEFSVGLFAHRFSVLSLEGLISSKRAAGRPKDLLTLPELEALREGGEK
jgi:hypothetical protein